MKGESGPKAKNFAKSAQKVCKITKGQPGAETQPGARRSGRGYRLVGQLSPRPFALRIGTCFLAIYFYTLSSSTQLIMSLSPF